MASLASKSVPVPAAPQKAPGPARKPPLRTLLPGNQALLRLQRKCSCGDGVCDPYLQKKAMNMVRIDTLPWKCATPTVSRRETLAIQLQSSPERPPQMEPPGEEGASGPAPSGLSQEIPDIGEGVASIEAGGTGPAQKAAPEKEQEAPPALQAKAEGLARGHVEPISPGVVLNQLGSGVPIDPSLRASIEGPFRESFSGVRFHTYARARELASALGAHAFTIGEDIAFAEGKFQPGTAEGRRLIVHELTHVIQQRRGLSGALLRLGIGVTGDEYEREADRKADEILSQKHPAMSRAIHPDSQPSEAPPGCVKSNGRAIQLFSGSAAAGYARKWALSTNSAYGRFGNDCTNFASQSMEAGGWSMLTGSYCDDRKKDSVWWFKPGGCTYGLCPWSWCPDVKTINASYTWGGAHNFFNFIIASGRGTSATKVSDLVEGDVLQMDFGGRGQIGHTMVATKKTPTNLYFSYHTSDHLDEPFWPDGSKKGILDRNKTATYYGWRIK